MGTLRNLYWVSAGLKPVKPHPSAIRLHQFFGGPLRAGIGLSRPAQGHRRKAIHMRPLGCILLVCGSITCAPGQWRSATTVYTYPSPPTPVVVVDSQPVTVVTGRDKPYMIAFKSGKVVLANQYWVYGGILSYVTADHERKDAALETVDRALSERFNREQNLDFTLPPAAAAGEAARQQQVHRPSSAPRRRNRCACRQAH